MPNPDQKTARQIALEEIQSSPLVDKWQKGPWTFEEREIGTARTQNEMEALSEKENTLIQALGPETCTTWDPKHQRSTIKIPVNRSI